MNFAIRAVRDGMTTELSRAAPTLSVAKARAFPNAAWTAVIIDADGISYSPSEFDHSLLFDRPHASQLESGNDVLDVVSGILKKRIE